MKVALHYSRVVGLEVAFLRGISDWILRFKHQTKTEAPNETIERIGGQRFLSHILTCATTSYIEGVVGQGIYILRARWDMIGIHTTEHYIAKEILTSQDGGSGATELLCAD